MTWIFEKAQERAESYGIQGVTYDLTMGVVKNIIPAIASTNALISASCVNEAIKVITGASLVMNDYMQYMGQTNVTTLTYESDRQEDCLVCQRKTHDFSASVTETFGTALDRLKSELNLVKPNVESYTLGKVLQANNDSANEKHLEKLGLTFE
jgi:ubiquitin-activating enzyme E1 C